MKRSEMINLVKTRLQNIPLIRHPDECYYDIVLAEFEKEGMLPPTYKKTTMQGFFKVETDKSEWEPEDEIKEDADGKDS